MTMILLAEMDEETTTITGNIVTFIKLFFTRAIAAMIIYFSGYYSMNPLWLIIFWALFKYRDQKRLENRFKQEAAIAISLRNDRELIIANLDPPPSWVNFPDNERCEWLNKVISHLWPTIVPFIIDIVKTHIEPSINEVMSAYKKNPNFCFKDLTLGAVTPRVSGINVFAKRTKQCEQIIIDMDLFYAGDSVFSFSLMNVVGGIDNFEINGWIRAVVKPVVKSGVPIPGGIEIFFLRKPKIDFNVSGVLDVLSIPGISGLFRKAIDDQIDKTMIFPNRITIKLDDNVDAKEWKFPDPEGLLRIDVIEAKGLSRINCALFGSRKPDPYVTIMFGPKTYVSSVVKNSANPVWKFSTDIVLHSYFDETISVEVNDKEGNADLGTVSIDLNLVIEKTKIDSWIQLEGVTTGMIHVNICYFQLDNDPQKLFSNNLPALLEIFVDDANNIVYSAKKKRQSVARLTVGNITQTSKPVLSENPVFGEIFSFLVKTVTDNKLEVKLVDQNTKKSLGNTFFELKRLKEANNMEIKSEKTQLKNKNRESMLSLSMRLRALEVA